MRMLRKRPSAEDRGLASLQLQGYSQAWQGAMGKASSCMRTNLVCGAALRRRERVVEGCQMYKNSVSFGGQFVVC